MAPSRRRGAGKAAAAAAAARRQWKVGDLVLAKVKGFPAWPATVSEPEKWGYAADWKKVLVYFFGTQQIAFCNPADVEAFTEEKKQSLLIKRQGRGADFGRAVQEIIDSYEKSRKQARVDDFNSGDEVTLADGGNSVESSAHIEFKDQRVTSEATITGKNDSALPTDDGSDVAQIGSFHDKEVLGQPTDNVVSEKPTITTYTSRKRSGGLRSRKRATQKKAPSVEGSRSSSRLESSRFQNFMMPSIDGNKSAGDASTNVIRDRSSRRNKRIRKSPDTSEWDDVDSSAFASNGSAEDNGSEIITADSDSFSLNEGSTIDSGCRLEHSETVVECLEGDVELSKGFDFQIKAVVIKKKRKPNRKRTTNEAAEPSARLETEADLEVGVHKSSQTSQNACENFNERYNKEDGDEHLPLVKRARVRMGKPSSLEEEHNSISQAEEKTSNDVAVTLTEEHNSFCQAEERTSNEVAVNTLEQVSLSTTCNCDFSTNGDSFVVKEALDDASPPKDCIEIPGNRTQLLRVKEIQSFVCSADGEAALPPSKRLHRALEAMSANAAEEGLACAETSTMNTLINDSSTSSSIRSSSHMAIETKERNASGELGLDSLGHRVSAVCCSSSTILEESSKLSFETDICNQLIETSKSQEPCKDAFPEAVDHDDGKDLRGLRSGACKVSTAFQVQSPVLLMPSLDRRRGMQSNHGSLDQLLLLKDDGDSDNIELRDFGAENPDKGLDASEQSGICLNLISGADETAKVASQNGTNVLRSSAEDTGCENAESLRSQIDDNGQANGMCEVANDIKYDQKRKEASYVSNSEDLLGEKDVLGQSSQLPADGVESPVQTSPPTTSICHVSTSESANFIQNSGCSSPNTHSHPRKPVCTLVADDEKHESAVPQRLKSVGRWSNCAEAHTGLSSFESMLGSLTRTKESIGRATRMAIDCAKFGVSAKVVEILVRNLECESSLHRRVDLFFLVDSIAQCSRGLKGDVGIYPSVIQSVLPRLLSAAAPPGSFAQENRRQCMKVLRLWLERRILPESIIRHHMRELDSLGGSSSAGAYSRRSARTERALDDPVRDMEGMLVDEYGSNSSFQLPGFCMPRMLKDEDEGSDSDGGSFEAVTPEHNSETPEEQETNPAAEKHTHILEDVDGELEMEDVAPNCVVEMSSTTGSAGVGVSQNTHDLFERHFPLAFVPPLPQDVPPTSPPLPSSPPPPPPPPPLPPAPPCMMSDQYTNGVDSKHYTTCNIQDDFRQSVAQQSVVPRINPSMSNAGHYDTPECRDHTQVQLCDTTSSFSSYPACQVNSVQHSDGPPSFHHKAYPPRPPHAPPSNQFSYVHAGQHVKSRRETPPLSYSRRFHSSHNVDGGNFYNNHERIRPAPHELDESWRSPAPPFYGPRYPDRTKASYAPVPYGGPPREPTRLPHQEWAFPPRGMHHRNFMPFRPPSEGAVPVANRAPSIWRPR